MPKTAINFLDGNTYGNDGTLYGIVVVTHNGADGVDAYSANGFTAAESTAGTSNGSLALQWGADGGAGAATTWQSTSVIPEPTSGLLLLLGVAGLALRRRRA